MGGTSKGGGKSSGGLSAKLRKLGLLDRTPSGKERQFTFELFFPRPPYFGAQYRAARGKDGLFNFVGLVLGHGGATVQRIQKASGAKIEVRDSAGNLNGAHPSSHGDPSLHAWVAASSRQRLDKAVGLLLEVLQPTNTQLQAVAVSAGSSVVLRPAIPRDWPQAAEAAAAEAAEAAERLAEAELAAVAASAAAPPPPPPAANAWASNRLLKQMPASRQFSPMSTLQRSQGPIGSSKSSSDEEESEPAAAAPQAAVPPPPPPPPPPPRSGQPVQASDVLTSPIQSASPAPGSPVQNEAAAAPAVFAAAASAPLSPTQLTAAPATPLRGALPPVQLSTPPPAPAREQLPAPQPAQQLEPESAQLQQVATVWATGLHTIDATPELPMTPTASAEHAALVPEPSLGSSTPAGSASLPLSGTMSSALSGLPSSALGSSSWSLWGGAGGSGPSFYEELQAAASDTFSARASLGSHPSGLSSHPSGLSSHPSGLSSHPSGLSSHPSGLSSHPSGLSSHPSGLHSAPSLSPSHHYPGMHPLQLPSCEAQGGYYSQPTSPLMHHHHPGSSLLPQLLERLLERHTPPSPTVLPPPGAHYTAASPLVGASGHQHMGSPPQAGAGYGAGCHVVSPPRYAHSAGHHHPDAAAQPYPGFSGLPGQLSFAPPGALPPYQQAAHDAELEMQQLLAAVASMATHDG